MVEQAPYKYISDYYDSVQKKNAAFPDVAEFWLSGFRHVIGRNVLNLGCGPMFYDNLLHFGEVPDTYVGLDLNENSFAFLDKSDHPALVKARSVAVEARLNTQFIVGDVFDQVEELAGKFDTVLGIGFFGTFEGQMFDDLIAAARKMLKPDGKLLKMTWHGTQRSDEETSAKLKYRYDNVSEPAADELVHLIEQQGFTVECNDVLNCPPNTVGWDAIQVAVFRKASS